MAHEETTVSEFPMCDFCNDGEPSARYDAKTILGPWAFMCEKHYKEMGYGLGLGKGQRLTLG